MGDRMERKVYQKLCIIRTKGGHEYKAKLIHLNPRYCRKADNLDVWRREGDLPKKERYIKPKDVKEWKAI